MRKIYVLITFFLLLCFTKAQVKVQGIPRTDVPALKVKNLSTADAQFSFSDIQYWVGEGENQAALVIQWNDEKNPDALVWGYKWTGNATGEDMIRAILKADPRMYSLFHGASQYGSALAGFGYDLNGKNTISLIKSGNTTYPLYPVDGIVTTEVYDFDDYKSSDADDHWQSGWYQGYWSYWVRNSVGESFNYSMTGMAGRALVNGSWDLWNYNPDMMSQDIADTFTAVSPYVKKPKDFTKGTFIINEGWFGHESASLNYVDTEGDFFTNLYVEINDNKNFGNTASHGTFYGGKLYVVSKQNFANSGGRLVVADASTLQYITHVDTLGGDGRAFVGVDEEKAYITTSSGISIFDIKNISVAGSIAGVSGEYGNIIRTSQYVYAIGRNNIVVINPKTDEVLQTIEGSYNGIVQAKDGSVWVALTNKLALLDEQNFSFTYYDIPTAKTANTWFAWHAGSFTASEYENAIYWIDSYSTFGGKPMIVKFDVTQKTFNENFAEIPGQRDEAGTALKYKQIPYASALRVDPHNGNLVLTTVESGFGAHYQKNWVHYLNPQGQLIKTIIPNDYYWFPSISIFPDVEAPKVSANLVSELTLSGTQTIDLKDKVSDEDNNSFAIVKSVSSNSHPEIAEVSINQNDELVMKAIKGGETIVVLNFNSNGKVVTHSLKINVGSLGVGEVDKKADFAIYPNPTSDYIRLKTDKKVQQTQLYDISGKLVYQSNNGGKEISVKSLNKGLYILKAVVDNEVYTEKILVK